MKQAIFLTLSFFITFYGHSKAANPFPFPPAKPAQVTSLVVNANVTIVLVTRAGHDVQVTGDALFMNSVSIIQNDGKLVVDGNRNRNLKGRGVIYVPATDLQQISINNAAFIRSSNMLINPSLRIHINGNCKVHISTSGRIDFVENDLYEVEYQIFEKNSFKAGVAKSRQ